MRRSRTSGWNLFILSGVVVAAIAFVVLLGGSRESRGAITTAGGEPPAVAERNCPHPSPGQWCPWVDDGQVQPQPVWP